MAKYIDKSAIVAEIEKLHGNPFYRMAIKDVLSIIDSLQEENSFDSHIQEGDNVTLNENSSRFNRSQLERVIVKQEEPVSNDLEEAATKYAQDKYMPVQTAEAFRAGYNKCRQEMMNSAIEREVKVDAGGYTYIDATELYDYDNDKPLAKAGDKIKVLIVKDK